jgi:hypothetical protein
MDNVQKHIICTWYMVNAQRTEERLLSENEVHSY